MAKIDWVEARLQRWADVVTSGRDGSGFPSINVLSREWMPPTPGTTPTLKVAASVSDIKATHHAIGLLSLRMRNTMVVHYCLKLPVAEQAERLECAERTVLGRVEAAHRLLSKTLSLQN